MKKKKSKFSIKKFLSEAWMDLKFKLIIIGSVFIAIMISLILVVSDIQSDKKISAQKIDKYETYIDNLLLEKFTTQELKNMNQDELKLAVDMVIDEMNNSSSNAPVLKDFILPIEESDYTTVFKLTREPKTEWNQEDIDPFWIDLDKIDIKDLDDKNFDFLKTKLKDVR